MWSNLCICSPGVVELVRSNLAPDFPLFHEIESQFSEQGSSRESEHGGGKWSDTNCGLFVLLLTQNLFYVPANTYLLWTWFWNGNFRYGPRVEQKQTLMCLYPAPRTL